MTPLEIILTILTCLLSTRILIVTIKNLINKEVDDNLLMLIVIIACLASKEFLEAIIIALLYQIGEMVIEITEKKISKSIIEVNKISINKAKLLKNGEIQEVDPITLVPGDLVLINNGEIIPCDGEVVSGDSFIDYSALTGEQTPVRANESSIVYSSGTVLSNSITVKVNTNPSLWVSETIKQKLEEAKSTTSKKEKIISKFSAIAVPVFLGLFFIIAFLVPYIETLITKRPYLEAMDSYLGIALSLLILSCPCALIINIPLVNFYALGELAKSNILIKDVNSFSKIINANYYIFDKTGTLTSNAVISEFVNNTDYSNVQVKQIIKSIELFSSHPKAKIIVSQLKDTKTDITLVTDIDVKQKGITANYDNIQVKIGTSSFIGKEDLDSSYTYFLIGDKYGYFKIIDQTASSISELTNYLTNNMIYYQVCSGDSKESVETFCKENNIAKYNYEVSPVQKEEIVKNLNKDFKPLFIGDGINDALALKQAYLGIAMTSNSLNVAKENSEVVILSDDINKISSLREYSKYINKLSWIIIFGVLGVKALLLLINIIFKDTNISFHLFNLLGDIGLSIIVMFLVLLVLKKKKVK